MKVSNTGIFIFFLFRCRNQQHIPFSQVCNFKKDCLDGSDEELCDNYVSNFLNKNIARKPPPVIINFDGLGDFEEHQIGHQGLKRSYKEDSKFDSIGSNVEHGISSNHTEDSTFVPYSNGEHGYRNGVEQTLSDKTHHSINVSQSESNVMQDDACPVTHFWCSERRLYCLPVYVRCNGVKDCLQGEDELKCESYQCPGMYRLV